MCTALDNVCSDQDVTAVKTNADQLTFCKGHVGHA